MRQFNSNSNNMRQKHGVTMQNFALNFFNFKPAKNGSIWDGYTTDNNETPVTIKTTCEGNAICLSDFRRQVSIDRDFIFVHIRMNKKRTKILDMTAVYVDVKNWRKSFGNLEVMDFMYKKMKNIKNDHSDDEKWSKLVNKIHDTYGEAPIRIAPKRDCGKMKQKRFQGSITLKNFRNVIVNENTVVFKQSY